MSGRATWDAMALVGRIARTHGHRGEVVVNPETDFPDERFKPGATLSIWRDGRVEPVVIESVRMHQGRPILRLQGVDTMTAAEQLAGLEVRIPIGSLATLPQGRYYRHDLIGCRVETIDGATVGTVQHIESDGGGDRLVVRGTGGEVLIPLAASICVRIDPGTRLIVIDAPEGLLDLNVKKG
jgi:16S rRNA processing protein RimM